MPQGRKYKNGPIDYIVMCPNSNTQKEFKSVKQRELWKKLHKKICNCDEKALFGGNIQEISVGHHNNFEKDLAKIFE